MADQVSAPVAAGYRVKATTYAAIYGFESKLTHIVRGVVNNNYYFSYTFLIPKRKKGIIQFPLDFVLLIYAVIVQLV
jgi:hypothetical protein